MDISQGIITHRVGHIPTVYPENTHLFTQTVLDYIGKELGLIIAHILSDKCSVGQVELLALKGMTNL